MVLVPHLSKRHCWCPQEGQPWMRPSLWLSLQSTKDLWWGSLLWRMNNPDLALKLWAFIDWAEPLSTLSLVCCYFRQPAEGLVPPAMSLRMTKPLYSIQENWMDEGHAGQRSWYFEELPLFRSGLLNLPSCLCSADLMILSSTPPLYFHLCGSTTAAGNPLIGKNICSAEGVCR